MPEKDQEEKEPNSNFKDSMKSFGAGLMPLSSVAVMGVALVAGAPLGLVALIGAVTLGGGTVVAISIAASKVKNFKPLPAIAGLSIGFLIGNSMLNDVIEQGMGRWPSDLDKTTAITQEFHGAACKDIKTTRKFNSIEFSVPSGCTADDSSQHTGKPSGNDTAAILKFEGKDCRDAANYAPSLDNSMTSHNAVIIRPPSCKPV